MHLATAKCNIGWWITCVIIAQVQSTCKFGPFKLTRWPIILWFFFRNSAWQTRDQEEFFCGGGGGGGWGFTITILLLPTPWLPVLLVNLNNSLIYLCFSSLSFKQLLTFITSQLNNQGYRALARLSCPSAVRLLDLWMATFTPLNKIFNNKN